jgi:lipopolysaccharide/colanic/teichoic acid biosynthesis glycosyltransferase
MSKRFIDIFFSGIGLIALSPFFIIISFLIMLDSKGGVFYRQKRVGKNNRDFDLFKFRTMYANSDIKGLLTVGDRDSRVTKVGYYLRKYKLDELPQLVNVFMGDMSLVGPRPEVRKYVNMYNERQLKVLEVKPGITDLASIKFRNENELLKKSPDPENFYIQEIMPQKLEINLQYLDENNVINDIEIILATFAAILK